MTRFYSAGLYPREAVIKAAYSMTDKYYVHLDSDKEKYMIELCPKESGISDDEIMKTLDN